MGARLSAVVMQQTKLNKARQVALAQHTLHAGMQQADDIAARVAGCERVNNPLAVRTPTQWRVIPERGLPLPCVRPAPVVRRFLLQPEERPMGMGGPGILVLRQLRDEGEKAAMETA